MPTREMERVGLPEGVLAGGCEVAAFLYLPNVTEKEKRLRFKADLNDGTVTRPSPRSTFPSGSNSSCAAKCRLFGKSPRFTTKLEDHAMKLQTEFLGGTLVAALAMGACDSLKPDLASVTGERDGLRTQLEATKAHETALTSRVANLNAKLAAAQPAKGATAKPVEHAQETPAKRNDKAGKTTAQAASAKKG